MRKGKRPMKKQYNEKVIQKLMKDIEQIGVHFKNHDEWLYVKKTLIQAYIQGRMEELENIIDIKNS